MDSGPQKRCLLCGQDVAQNAVKCSSCGKGRFETEKRHAVPRPASAGPRAAAAPGVGAPSRQGGPRRPEPAATAAPAAPPASGFLARLLARFTGKR
jgi:hypothetical protein